MARLNVDSNFIRDGAKLTVIKTSNDARYFALGGSIELSDSERDDQELRRHFPRIAVITGNDDHDLRAYAYGSFFQEPFYHSKYELINADGRPSGRYFIPWLMIFNIRGLAGVAPQGGSTTTRFRLRICTFPEGEIEQDIADRGTNIADYQDLTFEELPHTASRVIHVKNANTKGKTTRQTDDDKGLTSPLPANDCNAGTLSVYGGFSDPSSAIIKVQLLQGPKDDNPNTWTVKSVTTSIWQSPFGSWAANLLNVPANADEELSAVKVTSDEEIVFGDKFLVS